MRPRLRGTAMGLGIALSLSTSALYAGRDVKGEFRFQGRTRTYLLHLPSAVREGKPLPLVVVLHGASVNGEWSVQQTGFTAKSEQGKFIVVYPNGTGDDEKRAYYWNCGRLPANLATSDDVGFIRELVSRLQKECLIDSKRIFATGMSNGGMMAHRLGAEASEVFAAIAPVAGPLEVEIKSDSPVSVIMFHGWADETVPYKGRTPEEAGGEHMVFRSIPETGRVWAQHNGCKPKAARTDSGNVVREVFSGGKGGTEVVVYTIKNGGHTWPGRESYSKGESAPVGIQATDLIWEFFAKHPKQ
jgi:polyhydroxybutyrate depolymerase